MAILDAIYQQVARQALVSGKEFIEIATSETQMAEALLTSLSTKPSDADADVHAKELAYKCSSCKPTRCTTSIRETAVFAWSRLFLWW